MTGNADLMMEFHWARKSSAYSSKQQKNLWRFHDTGQYAQLNNFSITKHAYDGKASLHGSYCQCDRTADNDIQHEQHGHRHLLDIRLYLSRCYDFFQAFSIRSSL